MVHRSYDFALRSRRLRALYKGVLGLGLIIVFFCFMIFLCEVGGLGLFKRAY
jgi:hypothetical protein